MDNQTQELQATAEPAEAEREQAAAELGKFKDVAALKQAYDALEAEFTRRSQRLKELEKANKELSSRPAAAGNAGSPSQQAEVPAYTGGISVSDEIKHAVIEEYLNGVRANRSVPIIMGGSVIQAQRRVPQNLKEAGALARNFLKNKEENN